MTQGQSVASFDPASLRQAWPSPSDPRPIVIFGAGSVVGDDYLPAYRKAGFPVAGLFDPDRGGAEKLSSAWGVRAFASAAEACGVEGAVFDLATPPDRHAAVLRAVGRMANLQRFLAGEDAALVSSVEDAWSTMALVEAAYASSAAPATPIARRP